MTVLMAFMLAIGTLMNMTKREIKITTKHIIMVMMTESFTGMSTTILLRKRRRSSE
jgi:hypothetical protein